jgi:hypothetical protein
MPEHGCLPPRRTGRAAFRIRLSRKNTPNEAGSGSLALRLRVRLARLRRTNCFVSRSLGYLLNGQFRG